SAYVLGPAGATFSRALRLAIAYESAQLPPGCEESDLVIGYYDRANARWQELPSSPDSDHHVMSFETTHFSTFGLLAPTLESQSAQSAATNLTLSPEEVAPYDRVDVSVTVENRGDSEELYPLIVSVNGTQEYSLNVTLAPGARQTLRFTVVRSQPGDYDVSVGQLSHSFSVLAGPTSTQEPSTGNGTTASETNDDSDEGLHPVYVVLLALAGVALLSVVVLVFARVL
ncbi:MAG: hypothetical protein KAQ74_04270, partial [Dehalococcoidia bacterium]|nr:hypothetical protein [Dehalococcoidia bacterium]